LPSPTIPSGPPSALPHSQGRRPPERERPASYAALADFERSIIRDRTTAGLAAARAWGQTGGRSPALSDADMAAARALLADAVITGKQVAERLGRMRSMPEI
jgi:hypothetical protein